jgi:ComF family protein
LISINRRRVFTARLDEVKGKLIDFLFPPRCVGCGSEGSFICACCEASLPRLAYPICPTCSKPLAREDSCPHCRAWRPETDGIRSPFAFDGVVRQAIYQFKYGHFKALAAPLGQMLDGYLDEEPLEADVLVPVPLHSSRLQERGYNQSALLAAELGRRSGLPVVGDCLVRLRHTKPQVKTAGAVERQRNLAGAFGCRDGRLAGKRILLIDDVCTTGATLSSCARALRVAGASLIWGLALARES